MLHIALLCIYLRALRKQQHAIKRCVARAPFSLLSSALSHFIQIVSQLDGVCRFSCAEGRLIRLGSVMLGQGTGVRTKACVHMMIDKLPETIYEGSD